MVSCEIIPMLEAAICESSRSLMSRDLLYVIFTLRESKVPTPLRSRYLAANQQNFLMATENRRAIMSLFRSRSE